LPARAQLTVHSWDGPAPPLRCQRAEMYTLTYPLVRRLQAHLAGLALVQSARRAFSNWFAEFMA